MKEAVKSSNVDAMDYNEKAEVMTIFYKGGSTYEYSGVKESHKDELKTSPSFGKALHRLRKHHNWSYKKI